MKLKDRCHALKLESMNELENVLSQQYFSSIYFDINSQNINPNPMMRTKRA